MQLLLAYDNYRIPPNVVRHQLEVAAVGRWLCNNWQGEAVDIDLVTSTLLLHDMGNIIKFKRPFLGELETEADYWIKVQEEYFREYGHDVHTATVTITKELGLAKVVGLLEAMRGVWSNPETAQSWEARICEYADCHVAPTGIVDFETRLQDLMDRYHEGNTSPTIEKMRENGRIVADCLGADPALIKEIDFRKEIELLKNWEL